MKTLDDILREAFQAGASDIHFTQIRPPFFRVDGQLHPVGEDKLTAEDIKAMQAKLLHGQQRASQLLIDRQQADFSYSLPEGVRFRVNIFYRLGLAAIAMRLIPKEIKTLEQLNLPQRLVEFAEMKQGFILIVGPSGHGKSTTLAALIDYINNSRREHMITIEDPIEYQFAENLSIIDQREIGQDAVSFAEAVRATLRQDPNVIMIGELRDLETMRTAITLAETGHLVFGTLHTNDAAQAVERLIDSFPSGQQQQIRSQLAVALSGVISQRLLPWTRGGRIPATEIMIATPAIRNVIREGNIHQIVSIIQTSSEVGMQTLDASLQALVDADAIHLEDARPYFLAAKLG